MISAEVDSLTGIVIPFQTVTDSPDHIGAVQDGAGDLGVVLVTLGNVGLSHDQIAQFIETSGSFPQVLLDSGAFAPQCPQAAQEAIDLCVVRGPLQNAKLSSIPVLSPELLLAVPKNHPFCKRHPYRGLDQLEAVDLTELRDEPFSLLNHQRIGYIWKPLFLAAGFEPRIYRYSSMWSNIVDYIQSGKSVGFIDKIVVLHEPREDKLCYYRLNTGPITRDILVAFHPGKHLSTTEQIFIDVLKSYPLLSDKTH